MQRYVCILYVNMRIFADNMCIFAMLFFKAGAYEVNNE
jgi:hypothetical protein